LVRPLKRDQQRAAAAARTMMPLENTRRSAAVRALARQRSRPGR